MKKKCLLTVLMLKPYLMLIPIFNIFIKVRFEISHRDIVDIQIQMLPKFKSV